MGKIQRQLAAKLVPDDMMHAMVHSILGLMHTPFSLLYDPCVEALATALDQYHAIVWPVVLEHLEKTQAAALDEVR